MGTTDDIRHRLSDVARRRVEAEQDEDVVIVDAWRAGIPPTEIAILVGRSAAHVRRRRPADVPPARLGGNAKRPAAE